MQKRILKITSVFFISVFTLSSVICTGINDVKTTHRSLPDNELGIDEWPIFHHDLLHTGCSNSSIPSTNALLWMFTTQNKVLSSPMVANGKVYIGSNDGKMYCLDEKNGSELWEYNVGDWLCSSSAVADGMVFFTAYNGYAYCLNAETGSQIWTSLLGQMTRAAPIVAYGRVYVGGCSLYCLNETTGSLLWEFSSTPWMLSCCPAVSDGKIFFGSWNHEVYCMDAETGSIIWEYYETSNPICSSPSISEGKLFVGLYNGSLLCLNTDNGSKIWEYFVKKDCNYGILSSPSVFAGKVYFGAYNDNVYCLDTETGIKIWNYSTDGWIISSPAVSEGKVVIGSFDSKIYCFDANTGAKIWDYQSGAEVNSSPAIAYGKIFIGSDDGKVYCFGSNPVADFFWTPQNPTTNQTILFNASSSIGNITRYEWDWNNDGIYEESNSIPTITHSWTLVGNNLVTLRVTDRDGNIVTKTKDVILLQSNRPPFPPSIDGVNKSHIRNLCYYRITAIDPDGDNISYFVDWGDNTSSGWLGPYSSGAHADPSHQWNKRGTYVISAKARDSHGNESAWSTFSIVMPFSYKPSTSFWEKWLLRCILLFLILNH